MFKLFRQARDQTTASEKETRKANERLIALNEKVDQLEQEINLAILDGENQWFLTSCEKPKEPICRQPRNENTPRRRVEDHG